MDLSEPRQGNSWIVPFNGCDDSPSDASASSFCHLPNRHQSADHTERDAIMKPTEDLLSRELNKLSLQERSRAQEDLHCVGHGLEETPEMVKKALEDFDSMLSQGNYPIYEQAAQQNRAHVEDRAFRLMFLRASLYEIDRAVHQLIHHLHQKAKYFGEDKLGRNINLDDLNEDDIAVLLSGTFHIQADTDPIGRSILCCMGHLWGRWNFETIVRAHYYIMFNILLPLEEVQTKGLVIVYYDTLKVGEHFSIPPFPNMLKLRDYRSTVPIRYSAMHFCLKTQHRDNLSSNNLFMKGVLKTFTQYIKVRTRVHYGSDLEVRYGLGGYGIQMGSFPVDSEGNIRNDILNTWFFQHLQGMGKEFEGLPQPILEQSLFSDQSNASFLQQDVGLESMLAGDDDIASASSAVAAVAPPPSGNKRPVQPLLTDVLIGRGVRLMQHPGNVRFREFLEEYQEDYDHAQRNKRRMVSKKMVQLLQYQGVRFLQRNGDGKWVEADASEAENKVGQLFRSRRKLIKKS